MPEGGTRPLLGVSNERQRSLCAGHGLLVADQISRTPESLIWTLTQQLALVTTDFDEAMIVMTPDI